MFIRAVFVSLLVFIRAVFVSLLVFIRAVFVSLLVFIRAVFVSLLVFIRAVFIRFLSCPLQHMGCFRRRLRACLGTGKCVSRLSSVTGVFAI